MSWVDLTARDDSDVTDDVIKRSEANLPKLQLPCSPDVGYQAASAVNSSCDVDDVEHVDDSSDSDVDPVAEDQPFMRKISTNKEIKSSASTREGYLLKQTSSFQRWRRRYFLLKGSKLYYAKDEKQSVFEEVQLSGASVAETGARATGGHCFQVISEARSLTLCADSYTNMQQWTCALRSAGQRRFVESEEEMHSLLSGQHTWHVASHARPTYCNVCRDALSGVTLHGLSCVVCKFKCHRRCAARVCTARDTCKWTTLASVGANIIEQPDDGSLHTPHQWLEGNLPVSSRCCVCDKTCGSVFRLQDFRCVWCKCTVHAACRPALAASRCSLGVCRVSVVPPTALHNIGSEDACDTQSCAGCSPLLVFVNSKSGDHTGVKFLRRMRQLLNPAQVFDLVAGGPSLGLRLFRTFEQFRILVCGGDGSVGWVLSHIDKMDLHRHCQVGVLPLGTGNDLARVLGWGGACDDHTAAALPHTLDKYACATIKMLDRWSVSVLETGSLIDPPSTATAADIDQDITASAASNSAPAAAPACAATESASAAVDVAGAAAENDQVLAAAEPVTPQNYDVCLARHLSAILHSERHDQILHSAGVLCDTVRQLTSHVAAWSPHDDSSLQDKCAQLDAKLAQLVTTLQQETPPPPPPPASSPDSCHDTPATPTMDAGVAGVQRRVFTRANSVKRAVHGILRHIELVVDAQNADADDTAAADSSGQVRQVPQVEIENASPDEVQSPGSSRSQTARGSVSRDNCNLSASNASHVSSTDTSACASAMTSHASDDVIMSRPPSSLAGRQRCHNLSIQHSGQSLSTVGGRDVAYSARSAPVSPQTAPPLSLAADQSPLGVGDQLSGHGSSSVLATSSSNIPMCRRLSSLTPVPSLLRHSTPSPEPGAPSSFSSLTLSSPPPPLVKSAPDNAALRPVTPIISPLLRAANCSCGGSSCGCWCGGAGGGGGGGMLQRVLMAHADTLCAPATPLAGLVNTVCGGGGFLEKGVMNNYFGIGIDAKISLDFHNKREDQPHKCGSRTKNLMWYGVLGSKELIQKTCRNMEQRLRLECDGHVICLPPLQGIVVLNIPSFMGGTNFWGRERRRGRRRGSHPQHPAGEQQPENQPAEKTSRSDSGVFLAPCFDDRLLEVVAAYGTAQMAASRLINLHRHRIAQCHTVQITILGDASVPVEVDGEAWVQSPGVIRITHKNRVQMLARNRGLEVSLRTWHEKQQNQQRRRASSCTAAGIVGIDASTSLTDDEQVLLKEFINSGTHLVRSCRCVLAQCDDNSGAPATDTAQVAAAAADTQTLLHRLSGSKRTDSDEAAIPYIADTCSRDTVTELAISVRRLHSLTADFLQEYRHSHMGVEAAFETQLSAALDQVESELRHVHISHSLAYFSTNTQTSGGDGDETKRRPSRGMFRLRLRRDSRPHSLPPTAAPPIGKAVVLGWQADDVTHWLASLGLADDYGDSFARHDIRGAELLALERRDLKELGVNKIGHIKRLQQAIKEIKNKP